MFRPQSFCETEYIYTTFSELKKNVVLKVLDAEPFSYIDGDFSDVTLRFHFSLPRSSEFLH